MKEQVSPMPSPKKNLPVSEFVSPKKFEELKQAALGKGFKAVAAGPLVRSSYKAGELYARVKHL